MKKVRNSQAARGNTVVITDLTKYLEGIKSLLSDNSIFMQLCIDEDKSINYIINLESKLKVSKYLKMKTKFLKKNLIVFAQLALPRHFHTVILKYIRQSLITFKNSEILTYFISNKCTYIFVSKIY